MKFLTDTSEVCSTSLVSIKPTTLTIADSTFQYNTAYYQGGGLAILFGLAGPSEYFCCGAEVKITVGEQSDILLVLGWSTYTVTF